MKEELKALIDDARKLIEQLSTQEQKDELNAEISVLESQINSPKPKNSIIGEALKSLRNIAEGDSRQFNCKFGTKQDSYTVATYRCVNNYYFIGKMRGNIEWHIKYR